MAFFASLAVGADGMAWAGTMGDLATSSVYGLDPATGEVTRSVCGYSSAITMARDGSLYVNIGSPTNSCQESDRAKDSPGKQPCTDLETRAGIWKWVEEAEPEVCELGPLRSWDS
jgi:outer membrane protein assembly factor BamB